jgi:transaldolase
VAAEGLTGWERFPVSVETDPHIDDADALVAQARETGRHEPNFVIKIACTENGVAAARRWRRRAFAPT